ncbi:MAG: Protein GrpE [Candidatus Azambacteria bacterium GW2011_GWA2_39_10]|uniref:Protein GrpE n=1 Tax=Candidatus Azambacteria bacterium GW2011_GWA2_39_10 TaxID=1618611 RepID=A0A0G0LMM1_9BACT|nr:MAG: Protein GrpE [Candidatus Azambacteria bacterium GW2011_GWA2_39_10]
MDEENNNIENLRKQSDEYLNGWKRAKADYLNLKKEMEAQNKEIKEWMSKIMILPLLGIMDSFEKAFSEIPENIPPKADQPLAGKNEPWVKGIEGIKKQFEDYLKSQGVEVMAVKGAKFDPAKHEAVESIEGGESGKIVEELQKGYMFNSEILRPARVKIYK